MAESKIRSEDQMGRMWDRCIADTIIKSGTGTGLGAVASLALFKRRPWPVILGLGMGLGMGYANCQNDYRTLAKRRLLESPPKA